ncbi:MAG: HNH endonuclease, partial [Xanthobacteraceae bacterium]
LASAEAAEQQRAAKLAAKREQKTKFARFYSSRAWRAARWAFLKTQPQPLRCMVCSASSADTRICVDHVVAVKADFSRRLDPTNFGLLCTDCNLARGSLDADDYRPNTGATNK